ncbi:hypothetical protein WA026_018566 [Henosepilachna vigintioctopunctata]|uniref:Uncharacterized protein n=1 Tax=Henosepilachna vigintioctopunctata TaxID=420089 RepID=A0AAW1U9B3_9CUCU
MKIGVLILFEVLIQIFAIERDGLIDEIKVDGISRQNENMDRENVIESFGSPNSYEERSMYANINPFSYNNMMKRSPIDRNTGRRQTGIIYGDGKPIGILQPYEESFKFMPIKEEKVYALDGGRSDLNEQEPYLNLMYPLARFARSEDALKMAEYEAARAEFLEKHYPSMLVDFKIRDKLHANRAKSTHQEVKREEQNSGDMEKFEQKRQLELKNQNTGKRESEPTQKKPTQKREAEKPMKRDIENDQTADSSKREAENSDSDKKNARKRETEILQKAEANSSPKFEELTSQSGKLESQNQIKKKRENRLTDAEFDRLRNTISKRNSMENVDMIENDLRGLLNDMGLIEDDLEENAEEMEKVRSVVNEEINSDETADNPVLSKGKIESSLNQDDYKSSSARKKRTQAKSVANEEAKESSNSDVETEEEHVDRRRSNTNSPIDEKRVIDVNFITKNRGDKQLTAQNPQPGENRLRASDIPNKREAPALHGKDRKKSMVKSK